MTGQASLRCSNCHRRLADYENAIERGQVVVEVKCKCGAVNALILSTSEAPSRPVTPSAVSATRT